MRGQCRHNAISWPESMAYANEFTRTVGILRRLRKGNRVQIKRSGIHFTSTALLAPVFHLLGQILSVVFLCICRSNDEGAFFTS